MKKAIALIIALVLLGTIFGLSATYRNHKQAETMKTTNRPIVNTTQDKEITDEDIVVQTEDGKYKLYYKNNIATLTYEDAKLEFFTWGRSIELETPGLYYMDFDDDGKNELIIKLIDSFNDVKENSASTYSLFFVKPVTDGNGETTLSFFDAQSSLWKKSFDAYVNEEISQLKTDKSCIQFVMTNNDNQITYDEKTGITNNKYVGFAKADSNEKGEPYTVLSYYKGAGVYSIDEDGSISLDIQLFVTYEEVKDAYQIGNIHCDIAFDSTHFYIQEDTISFVALEEYEIADPRDNIDIDIDR